jgi:hypothetical protein
MRIAATLPLATAVLAGLLSLSPSPGEAQVVRIPGTTVSMTAPPGFRVARSFPGLEDPAAGSTIVVAEYPPDRYAEVAAVFASPKTASTRYAGEGVRITRIEPIAVGAAQVPLAVGSQENNGKEQTKYITVLGGGETNAVLVTFSLSAAKPLSRSDVENVVRSIKLARLPTLDEKVAQLSFKFTATAPFHVTDVPDRFSVNLGTSDGPDPTGMRPVAAIRRLSTTALQTESAKIAEQVLHTMAANAMITERMPVTFAGGQGYYLAAVADGRTIFQFLRVLPGGTFVQLVAVGETMAMADAADAVKQIAASVDLP